MDYTLVGGGRARTDDGWFLNSNSCWRPNRKRAFYGRRNADLQIGNTPAPSPSLYCEYVWKNDRETFIVVVLAVWFFPTSVRGRSGCLCRQVSTRCGVGGNHWIFQSCSWSIWRWRWSVGSVAVASELLCGRLVSVGRQGMTVIILNIPSIFV